MIIKDFLQKTLIFLLCGFGSFDLVAACCPPPSPPLSEKEAFKAFLTQVSSDLNPPKDKSPSPAPKKTTKELERDAMSLMLERWARTSCPTMGPLNDAVEELKKEEGYLNNVKINTVRGFVDTSLNYRLFICGSNNHLRKFVIGHTVLAIALALGLVSSAVGIFPLLQAQYQQWKNNKNKHEFGGRTKKQPRTIKIARFAGVGLTVLSVLGLFLFRKSFIQKAKDLNEHEGICFDANGKACRFTPPLKKSQDITDENGKQKLCKTNPFAYSSYLGSTFPSLLDRKGGSWCKRQL